MPQLYIVYFVFFMLLAFVHGYSVWQLYRTESLHPIIRLISLALLLEIISVLFLMIHYTTLERNGIGINGLKSFGELFGMAKDLAFIALLILVSKGWAVTTNVIPKRDIVISLVIMSVLTILYIALFVWDYATLDSALIYYFYQSIPGIMILVIRILVALWFYWNIFQILKLETLPEKRNFYIKWVIIFGSWLCILPLFVLILGSLEVWKRQIPISAIGITVDFIVFLILVVITWPTLARRYFTVMPGKSLLGYDFLSGKNEVYSGSTFKSTENKIDEEGPNTYHSDL